MERNNRKTFSGVVVSTKMEKTITVVVDTYKQDRLYGKRVKTSTKLHAHDEKGVAKLGDTVTIMETRPLSKTVRYVLVSVDKSI